MQLANLLFLVYPVLNQKEPDILEHCPSTVTLNLERGEWEYWNECHEIGGPYRQCEPGHVCGTVGVYDKTNPKHMAALEKAERELRGLPEGVATT